MGAGVQENRASFEKGDIEEHGKKREEEEGRDKEKREERREKSRA
jgi:hypothetical protein